MKISEYAKAYTSGQPIKFHFVLIEIGELIGEIIKMKAAGIKEEFEDVFHFFQLWLYGKFGFDGEIWEITRHSVEKFMARKAVWNKLYVSVGLPENISGYMGNYKKLDKVIKHLGSLGVEKEKAEKAYRALAAEVGNHKISES